jgi:flagellar hook protein FlgE
MGSVPSPNELEFSTGNVFYETRASGSMVLGQAGQNGLGALKAGALEGSTVALDDEFGKIMELKLYYQGCLMSMKQADQMASELIGIMK